MGKIRGKAVKKYNYTEETLKRALLSIDRGMSVRQASVKFGIPRTTLIYKKSGKFNLTKKSGPGTILSDCEEKLIVEWIHLMAAKGFPITKPKLLSSVKLYLNLLSRVTKFKDNLPGRKWYEGFLRRHPSLALRTTQGLTQSRSAITEKKIRNWHEEVQNYLISENLMDVVHDPSRIFNLDESAFYLAPKSDKVIVMKGVKTVHSRTADEKECITTLITGSADGKIVYPMILHKQKRIPFNIIKSTPSDWGLGRTDSGWMTGESFYEFIANVFFKWLQDNSIQFPVILYVDGHKSHLTFSVSEFCKNHDIILVALYPNATHILQPLDVAVFRPLKASWRNCVQEWKASNNEAKVKRENFAPILEKALMKTDMESHLKHGFRACGLYPFDANLIPYHKLLKIEKENIAPMQNNLQPEMRAESTPVELLEDQIEADILIQFKQSEDIWKGNAEYKALFEVWQKIKQKSETIPICTANNGTIPCVPEPEEIGIVLLPDADGNYTLDCDLPIDIAENEIYELSEVAVVGTDVQLDKELSKECIFENILTSTPTKTIDSALSAPTSSKNKSEPVLNKTTSPFKKVFFFPNDSGVEVNGNKRKTVKIPTVATSNEWFEFHKRKELEKETAEKLKNERKLQRTKSKEQRNNKKQKTTVQKLVANKVEENPNLSNKNHLKVGVYVIFVYEQEYFPGVIADIKDSKEVFIRSMVLSGVGWKWPEKEDTMWYDVQDVVEVIKDPVATNNRGQFEIIEIKKYQSAVTS